MKIDRLVSIIMILLDKKRVSAQELADRFEVSPRTIYRDIDAINRAGIPVLSTPGVGGGIEIMPQYKVDKKVFSTADLSAILMGLSSITDMMHGEELAGALAKVKSFVPADSAKDIEVRANQIHVDLSPWTGSKNLKPYLESIKEALQDKRLVSFGYADRYGNGSSRTIEPYQLVLKDSHWYVQGYCLDRSDFRLFRISRISDLEVLGESFAPREHRPPQLEFTDVVAAMQTRIKIRFHRSVMDRVLDLCDSEHVSSDGEHHYLVDFPFIDNDYNYSILLSFGDACECLEPLPIREEMKRRIQRMAALYES